MAGFGSNGGNNQAPAQAPEQAPAQTPSGEKVTQQELIQRLELIRTTPGVQGVLDRIKDIDINAQHDHSNIIPRMQEIFALIHNVNATNFSQRENAIWGYIRRLEVLYSEYEDAKQRIENDTRESSDAIIADSWLNDSDFFWTTSTQEMIASARDLGDQELVEAIQGIELSGEIDSEEAWNSLFADLRNKVPESERAGFDSGFQEFKQTNLYSDIDMDLSSLGGGLDEQTRAIVSGSLDSQFEGEGVSVTVDTSSFLFGSENLLTVGPFNDKRLALETIYKVKLVLSTLETQGRGYAAMYYMGIASMVGNGLWNAGELVIPLNGEGIPTGPLDGFTYPLDFVAALLLGFMSIIGGLLAAALPGAPILLMGMPLESGIRRLKDELAVWIGDRAFSGTVIRLSNGLRITSKFLGKNALKIIAGTRGFGAIWRVPTSAVLGGLYIPSKVLDTLGGGIGSILKSAEAQHLDAANLLTDKILLIDGLENAQTGGTENAANNNDAIEVKSRIKILALFRRQFEYEGNYDALEKLNKIAEKSIFVNSESFYIDIHRLLEGKIGDTSSEARRTRFWIDFKNVMWISNRKESIVKLYKERMRGANQMLGFIYKGISWNESNGSIVIPEEPKFNTFMDNLKSDIDHSLITHNEEIRRQKLIDEFIDDIKRGSVGNLTIDELKIELQKIADGFLPRFKILKEISLKRGSLSEGSVGRSNLEDFRRLVLSGDWWGTPEELQAALDNIETTSVSENKPALRDITETQKEGEKLRNHGLRRHPGFSSMINPDTYKPQLKMMELIIEAGDAPGQNIRNIERQLGLLFSDIRDTTKNIDFTVAEFNFAVKNILNGKRYAEIGDGRFGDASIDIDGLISNYSDFNTNINDPLETRLFDKIEASDYNKRLSLVGKILTSADLRTTRTSDRFTQISQQLETEVINEIRGYQDDIDTVKRNRGDAIRQMSFDKDDGLSNDISSLNDQVSSLISSLESDYNGAQGSRTKLQDRISFVESYQSKISVIRTKISELEAKVEEYTNRNTETRSVVDAGAETEEARIVPDVAPESRETLTSERIHESFERIILHDALTNGERSIMTNETMYFNLYSAMGAHFSRIEGTTVENIDERMLVMVREFAEKSGYNSDFPNSMDDVMDIERITQIMDSTLDANIDLKSSFSGIKRTPSGIFRAIFDNRSTFLRSIT